MMLETHQFVNSCSAKMNLELDEDAEIGSSLLKNIWVNFGNTWQV